MKKLFYRLSKNWWFIRLLPILAFAALGLYYPSTSFAVVYCKDNSPLTPCRRFTGTTCPSSFPVKCSTTGGATGSGSEWQATMKIGDLGIGIEVDANNVSKSVCGPSFIDFSQDTAPGQAVACTYTPDSGPTAGEPQPAQCFFDNLACRCNKVGDCVAGERTSVATCPTPSLESVPPVPDQPCTGSNCIILPGQNAAGCTGTLRVLDLNGNTIRGPGGSDGDAIQIGEGIAQLNQGQCQQVFGEDLPEFKRRVASTITQVCSTTNVATDPILEYAARSTDNFDSAASALTLGSAKCNPADGYPAQACTNDSGANITFSADAMFGIVSFPTSGPQACNANNFSCGQLPDLTFGPQPSKCTLDKKTGQCSCRCDRCTPDGTLVNAGLGDQGLFTLVHADSEAAVACSVRVTGQ
jgi:hypothetical protein